jgi:hypothetical protein
MDQATKRIRPEQAKDRGADDAREISGVGDPTPDNRIDVGLAVPPRCRGLWRDRKQPPAPKVD